MLTVAFVALMCAAAVRMIYDACRSNQEMVRTHNSTLTITDFVTGVEDTSP